MKNFEDIENKVFDLLSTTPYQLLTKEQQEWVLKVMDEEEYTANYNLINGLQDINKKIDIKINEFPKNEKKWTKLINYPIPVYKAVAAILIGMFITFIVQVHDDQVVYKKLSMKKSIPLIEENYPKSLVVKF